MAQRSQAVVSHAFNPSVPGQPGLHKENLSQKRKKKTKTLMLDLILLNYQKKNMVNMS